jgi:hypothetical protein
MLLTSLTANAFIYEGFLTDNNDVPIVDTVSLKLAIYYNVSKTCKVYEVKRDFTLIESDQGYFKIDLNSAVPTSESKNSDLTSVFRYNGTLNCSDSTTVTATNFSNEAREVEVSIKNSAGNYDSIGSFTIYEVPRAMQAANSEKFSGRLATDFLTKDLIQTCQNGSFLQYNVSVGSFNCSSVLNNITSSDITTTLGYTPISTSGGTITGGLKLGGPLVITGTSANPPAGAIWFDTATNEIKYRTTTGATQTLGVSGSGVTGVNGDNFPGSHIINLATTGSATFNRTDSGSGSHTLNIPLAATTGASYGLISNSDYNIFKNKLNSTGGTITGLLTVGSISASNGTLNIANNLSVAGNAGVNSLSIGNSGASFYYGSNSVTLRAPSSITGNSDYTWPISTPGSAGMLLASSTGGSLSWVSGNSGSVTQVIAGSGLLINNTPGATLASTGTISLSNTGVNANSYGSNLSIATFAVNAEGRITAAGNLAITQATNGVTGLLSGSDWTLFNSKLGSISGSPLTNGNLWIGNSSSQATAVLMSGDATITNTGNITVDGIQNVTVATSAYANGQFLQYSTSGGGQWINSNNGSLITNLSANNISSGTLSVSQGGIGVGTLTMNRILVGNGTAGVQSLSAGTSGQILISNGNGGAPLWSTATYPSTATVAGKILISNGTNFIASSYNLPLGNGSSGQVLQSNGAGGVTWAPGSTGSVTQVVAGAGLIMNGVTGATLSSTGTISLSNTGVNANSYGSNLSIATFAVNAEGRITAAGNLAITQATNSVTGLLSGSDWTLFNSKLGAVSGSTLTNGKIWIGSNLNQATAVTMSGDASITNTGNITVGTVGGKTAAQISTAVDDSTNATNLSTGTTLVKRDISGNFSANDITVNSIKATNSLKVQGGGAGIISLFAPTSVFTSYDLTLPTTAGSAGQVLGLSSTGTLVWTGGSLITNLNANNINSGTLTVSQGGLGVSTLGANRLLFGNGTAAVQSLTSGTSGQILMSSGNGNLPLWSTTTYPSTATVAGKILISNGTNFITSNYEMPLTIGSSGQVLQSDGAGGVNWAPSNSGSVTKVAVGSGLLVNGVAGGTITSTGTISLSSTGVSPNSYGSNISIATFSVNAEGRITAAGNLAITQATSSATGLLSSSDWSTFNSKLGAVSGSTLTNGKIWIGNNLSQATSLMIAGDASLSNTGTLTINNNSITNVKMATMGSFTLKGNNTGATATPTDISISALQGTSSQTFASGNDNRIIGAVQKTGGTMTGNLILGDGNGVIFNDATNTNGITLKAPANLPGNHTYTLPDTLPTVGANLLWGSTDGSLTWVSALTSGSMADLADGSIWIGNASAIATPKAINGDATMNNNGLLTISNSAITNAKIAAAAAIDATKISSGSVSNAQFDILSDVTGGVLPISRGGTGAASILNNFTVLYSNGTSIQSTATAGTTDQLLIQTVTGPTWTNSKFFSGSVQKNSLMYTSGADQWAALTPPTSATSVLVTSGSVPQWQALNTDIFSQYALLNGRGSGQVITGGTAAAGTLTLISTTNATKGNISLNPTGGSVGIGTLNPGSKLTVNGTVESTTGGFKFPDATIQTTAGHRQLVSLSTDVATTSTTLVNITGLSFTVTSAGTYRFEAMITYNAFATTVGSKWGVDATAGSTLRSLRTECGNTTTTSQINYTTTLNNSAVATSTGSPLTAGNISIVKGMVVLPAAGTLVIQFAAETTAGITVKAGSTLEWW